MAKGHWFGTYWADGDEDTVPFSGTPGTDYRIGHVAELWDAIEDAVGAAYDFGYLEGRGGVDPDGKTAVELARTADALLEKVRHLLGLDKSAAMGDTAVSNRRSTPA